MDESVLRSASWNTYHSKQVQMNHNTMQEPEIEYLCLNKRIVPRKTAVRKKRSLRLVFKRKLAFPLIIPASCNYFAGERRDIQNLTFVHRFVRFGLVSSHVQGSILAVTRLCICTGPKSCNLQFGLK